MYLLAVRMDLFGFGCEMDLMAFRHLEEKHKICCSPTNY